MIKQKLNKINFYKNIFYLCVLYIFFLLSIIQSFIFENIFSYIFLSVITLVFLKFISEFLHECVHWNFFYVKKINDLIGIIFLSPWFLKKFKNYRKDHFSHHGEEFYFSENDPDGFLVRKLFFLVGQQIPKEKIKSQKNKGFSINIFGIVLHIGMICFMIYFGSTIDLIIYLLTVYLLYPVNSVCRNLSQHFDLLKIGKTKNVNNIKGTLIEQIFFNSDLLRFHDEHHKNPSYDFRKLKEKQNKKFVNDITTMKCIKIFLNCVSNHWKLFIYEKYKKFS